MPNTDSAATQRYRWAMPGDVNAFFGLMLDNIAGLVLLVSILAGAFQFPVNFALRYMVPGTAIGVLVGDLLFFGLAFIYARRTGRTNVTAMPLGLDTPSTIGMALLVLGPSYAIGVKSGLSPDAAAMQTWHIGMCAILITGIIKAVLAFCSGWIHRVFPRAGLLGSLAAIALVLIAFNQMPEIIESPIVGMASLTIVLVTLIGRQHLPFKIPGALGAVAIGTALFYLLLGIGSAAGTEIVEPLKGLDQVNWFPKEWMTALRFEWLSAMPDTVPYLGYIVPFAVATVIGGIDCTESAASVGDDYHTPTVIGIEAFATLLAAVCGGVIQTTPYIGHPAYKAMGGRAAYVLATALFIGGAGLIGYFSYLFAYLPKAALLPILVFIGLEITAQSFHATPRRHYAALAIAFIPATAKLIMIFLEQFGPVINYEQAPFLEESLRHKWLMLSMLAGGFILTSLIWASATAKIIDRRFNSAAIYFAVGGVLTLFGIMHSPLPGDQMFGPWQLPGENFSPEQRSMVLNLTVAYFVIAAIIFGLSALLKDKLVPIDTDEAFENME